MTKKTTRKKKRGKAVVSMADLEKRMAVHATDAKARIKQPVGNVIGIRNSKFSYKQEVIPSPLRCIVVDFVQVNTWYDGPFDPDNPGPPACFAQSVDGVEMQPDAISPVKQSNYCNGCPQDAWGSADVGDGKACKNNYRLAVIAPDKNEDASEAEFATLMLPPTSLKNWEHYVRGLDSQLGRAPYGVITEFHFDRDEEWPVLIPKVDSVINDPELLNKIMNRLDDARSMLMEPFDVSGYEKPTKKRKKVVKNRAVKKTAKKGAKKKARQSKLKFS